MTKNHSLCLLGQVSRDHSTVISEFFFIILCPCILENNRKEVEPETMF